MPDRLITALLLLAVAAVSPARATERVLLRDYPALPGATLKIDTYRGSVDVRESPDNRIHVEIHEDPGTDEPAEADRILGALKLDVTQDGATVSIVARNPGETGVHFVWQDRQKIILAYAVLVPRIGAHAPSICAARTAALRGLSSPTHATGTPGGICTIERIASSPPAAVSRPD